MALVKTIELDCAPGSPRPDAYIGKVLEGTGIEVREPVSKLFGNWTWKFDDVSDEKWLLHNDTFAERIKELHSRGCIRYGSW